ncbi:NAD(P)H-dependent oxidoreductase [Amycolatopsis sp. NPDC051371]|uniref:NAD(P)H-dependent oxidoreductase n=1 Tax=Amycolatopsis sp. NPDC051371 TaxID=3155800 RepID=UPI0034187CC5
MRVLVITGSTRPVRVGDQLTEQVVRIAKEAGLDDVDVADLRDVALPLLDEPQMAATRVYLNEHTRAWSARVNSADAVVLISPQYNFGYPAGLKNAIDYLFAEWRGKPGLLVSYGARGGIQSYDQLAQVLRFVGLVLDPLGVQLVLPRDAYSEHGTLIDPAVVVEPYADELRAAFVRLADAVGADATPDSPVAVPAGAIEAGDRVVTAFNAHDPVAFADAFAGDGWFTDVLRHRAATNAEIEELHRFAFAGPLAQASLEVTGRRSRLLSSTAAVLELDWTSTGHAGADGDVAQRRGVLALVVSKNVPSGRWEVVSGINNDYTHAYSADPLGRAPERPV